MPDGLIFKLKLDTGSAEASGRKLVAGLKADLGKVKLDFDVGGLSKTEELLARSVRLTEEMTRHVKALLDLERSREAANRKVVGVINQESTALKAVVKERQRAVQAAEKEAAATTRVGESVGRNTGAVTRSANAATGSMNRTTAAAYQLGQAFEDWSYAGPRAAANNLSFLVQGLGGKAGLYGTLAVTAAVAVPMFVDALTGAADVVERERRELDELNASLAKNISLSSARHAEAEKARFHPDITADATRDRRTAEREERHQLRLADKSTRREHLMVEAQEIARELNALHLGAADTSRDEHDRRQGAVRERLEQYRTNAHKAGIEGDPDRFVYRDVGWAERPAYWTAQGAYGLDPDLMPSGKVPRAGWFGGADAELDKYRNEHATSAESARQKAAEAHESQAVLRYREEAGKALAESARNIEAFVSGGMTKRHLSPDAQGFGTVNRQFSEYGQERERAYRDRVDTYTRGERDRIDDMLTRADDETDVKVKAEMYREAERAAEEMFSTVEGMRREEEALTAQVQTRAELYGRMGHEAESQLKTAERGIDAEERLADKIRERIKTYEEARDASARSFASRASDTERGIARKESDERLQRSLAEDEAKAAEYRRRFDVAERAGFDVSGMRRQMEAELQARKVAAERSESERIKRREAEIDAANRKALRERADSEGRSGNFDDQLTTLKSLQGEVFEGAGRAGSSREMKGLYAEAQRLQAEIEGVYGKAGEQEKAALKASEERHASLTQKSEELRQRIEELHNIDIVKPADVARAEAIRLSIEAAADAIKGIVGKGIEAGTGAELPQGKDPIAGIGNVGGVPIASAGVAPSSQQRENAGSVTNQQTQNFYANVNGVPTRPSLTLKELSEAAARESKAASMRLG